ncbi:hypothetical protein Rmet_3362 [Cupriavidus metallidurans CH34]|uniref:Uncharacterized protein n=1 Tax=Cupriavidus metallidurans (strain ATCC 43123 / DSM 2839 / NBRC 102507 / CH34) TaxID=266264 RepID=Q1LHZ2_CUPMC|nr:hypothetical protein Rmet_3362 [Cupriavidus metallidurans CH34]
MRRQYGLSFPKLTRVRLQHASVVTRQSEHLTTPPRVPKLQTGLISPGILPMLLQFEVVLALWAALAYSVCERPYSTCHGRQSPCQLHF